MIESRDEEDSRPMDVDDEQTVVNGTVPALLLDVDLGLGLGDEQLKVPDEPGDDLGTADDLECADDDDEDMSELAGLPVTPNGGWGWGVTAASFLSNLIVDGVCYTFGIFFAELLKEFRAGRGITAFVGSLTCGICAVVGPVAGALMNKYGCRAVAIAGSAIASVFFVISSFSVNIEMMLITYGLFGGIGFGLMYLPSIVMVGYYFDERRALAIGIAVCGSGIGTFVMAPLASTLIRTYLWRGAQLIIGAIVLNGLICGAVYRPIVEEQCYPTESEGEVNKPPPAGVTSGRRHRLRTITTDSDSRRMRMRKISRRSLPPNLCLSSNLAMRIRQHSTSKASFASLQLQRKPFDRQDILYSGSLWRLPEYKRCGGDMYSYVNSVTALPTIHSEADSTEKQSPFRIRLSRLRAAIGEMLDFSLLKSFTFLLVATSDFLTYIGMFTPIVYMTEKAVEQLNVEEWRASLILSVYGVCNTLSRVLTGLLVDCPRVDSLLVHNIAAIIAGVATCLVAVIDRYELLMVVAAIFGLFIASFVTLRSIIIVELLGIQRLTSAFGLLTMGQGIAILIGSPLAGALLEATDSYAVPFIVSGSLIALGGLTCLPARRVAHWEVRRRERQQQRQLQHERRQQWLQRLHQMHSHFHRRRPAPAVIVSPPQPVIHGSLSKIVELRS